MNIQFKDREKKIIECIEEITGVRPTIDEAKNGEELSSPHSLFVKNILLVSSSFQYFSLEEEGRLGNLFSEHYAFTNQIQPPRITHVETAHDCLQELQKKKYDLVIVFNKPTDNEILPFANTIKNEHTVPIFVLGSNIKELSELIQQDSAKSIDKCFTWNGDGKIIFTMIQLLEDSIQFNKNLLPSGYRAILLIEDSIQFYSTYLLLIYEEILKFLSRIMDEDVAEGQRWSRYEHRPIVLHAHDFDQGKTYYDKIKNNLIGIISDNQENNGKNQGKHLGVSFAQTISKEQSDLPVLIQSSDQVKKEDLQTNHIRFISKNAPELVLVIKDFVNNCFGPWELVFSNQKQQKIYTIVSIKELENILLSVDDATISQNCANHTISKWLTARGESKLAQKIFEIEEEKHGKVGLQKHLIDVLEEYKFSSTQSVVTAFQRAPYVSYVDMSRIGKGSLGGKARGMSFLAKLISKYVPDNLFPKLRITVPRTIVLSTDVFDAFMNQNKLLDSSLFQLPDDRIAMKFMAANLPATVLGDLRAFIRKTRKPLVARSSGVLEDSLLQSFAGIYDSILLPNESWETDFRFQEVCNAIKYVYASTFFQKARTYIQSTSKNIHDEKMAVILQEVVGHRHEEYFYPAISGVAKSYNYYPSPGCKPEDGIAYLALGLGKAIVDGGCSFCFCPSHPRIPLSGTPKDFIKFSQRKFYALNLKSVYRIVNRNEETTMSYLDIDVAQHHGVLDKLVSTYIFKDDRLYPGLNDEGSLVLDFAPILQEVVLPVAQALQVLLRISEIALGHPVEIEFAINIGPLSSDRAELIILQVRSMLTQGMLQEVEIQDYNSDTDFCYSENALGNGIIGNLYDVVYVKQSFDMGNSQRAVNQIKKLNSRLMNEGKAYLLIGPGRWGSADPWLGIPVIWSDIAGVKIIIETPFKERAIDPSQGSHFFHDLISSQVGYIITKRDKGDVDFSWLDSLSALEESDDVRYVRLPSELVAFIDGKTGKAVIRKKKRLKKDSKLGETSTSGDSSS